MARFTKGNPVFVCRFEDKGRLFSRNETLRRAKTQIGKRGFNAVFNNCEHFARWCKTGRYESYQVLGFCAEAFGWDKEPRRIVEEFTLDPFGSVIQPIFDSIDGVLDKLEDICYS
jgi:hypothetical protein